MCLKLKSEKTKKQIAKKDIVAYKALGFKEKIETINRLSEVKHGDSFKGIIFGVKCEGKIAIQYDTVIFFCTDKVILDGNDAEDKLGYKYSWRFDSHITKIIVNNNVMYDSEAVEFSTPYRFAKVEIGETYTSEISRHNCIVDIALHSYSKLKDVIENHNGRYSICKCVIPKGSTYYKGLFCKYSSYASDKLMYVKIIK